jgi:hypothetical protein
MDGNDARTGGIMDVEASRAIRQAEVSAARTIIKRTEQRFDIKPERLTGDAAYGSQQDQALGTSLWLLAASLDSFLAVVACETLEGAQAQS